MFLRTEHFPQTRLIGKRLQMSFANNLTAELWASFMPERHCLRNCRGTEFFSVQKYPEGMGFFDPYAPFEKWAAIAVDEAHEIPDGMECLVIPYGMYAVFLHSGPVSQAAKTFGYIFGTWLPNSVYELDPRPHFEILGEKYSNVSEDSEEEIFIPIRKKLV